jgi:transcription elongation factor Elf1
MKCKIKHCPFCHSSKLKLRKNKNQYWIECSSCQCSGPVTSKENVVSYWNRRIASNFKEKILKTFTI